METEDTRKLIDEYYRALTAGDRATVAALVADECVWQPPATANFDTVEGGDAVVAELTGDVVKRTFDISKPFNLEVRAVIVDGEKAVVQQRLTATAKATGDAYDNQYCWVYTCRDGQIVHMEEYADTLLASRVMGWDQAEA